MKKKLTKKLKLTLNRESIRRLNREETSWVAGGAADKTDEPFCVSNAVTCEEVQCLVAIE